MSCVEGNTQVVCTIACQEGFAFAVVPASEYVCRLDVGRWTPEEKFPDCAGKIVLLVVGSSFLLVYINQCGKCFSNDFVSSIMKKLCFQCTSYKC